MAVNVDNSTFILSNSSNNTVMHVTYDGFLCVISGYFYMAVICMIILPVNIGPFVLRRKTNIIDRGSASYGLFHLNLNASYIMFCIVLVFNIIFALNNLYNFATTFCTYMIKISLIVQAQFHTWICVEYYLAVVHPIYYLKLKQPWYKIVWVSFTWVAATVLGVIGAFTQNTISLLLFTLPLSGLIVLILFCGLATLARLKKPNPDKGEKGQKLHQQKIKAFKIITLTLVVLIVTYLPYTCLIFFWDMIRKELICIAIIIAVALILPGAVIQPLLYISRFFKAKGIIT